MTHFRLNFTLILLTVIFIGLICLTNEDPIFREYFFNNVDLENFHTKAAFKFLYDSSVGGIISILFYILFVQIPANKSRKRIKKNLEQQFKYFKKTCIIIILGVGKNIFDFDLVEKLLDQNQFRLYFNSPSKISGQTNWHYFLNNVDQEEINRISLALQIFRDEINFSVSYIEIESNDVFEFMRNLSIVISELNNVKIDYDSIKSLGSFLWWIFTGFDFINGYKKADVISRMIKSI